MRYLPRAIVVAALALTLTGCAGNPVQGIIEGVVEDQTGIDVSTGSGGQSASLPSGWPDLPLPSGTITSSLAAGTTFAVTFEVDAESEVDRLIDELMGSGYSESSSVDFGELKGAVFESSEYTVSLTWTPNTENGKLILNYGVSPKG